jgi:hemerythrin
MAGCGFPIQRVGLVPILTSKRTVPSIQSKQALSRAQPCPEHDYFLDLLCDIQQACSAKTKQNADEIPIVIDSLIELFQEHFDDEERLMRQSRYPDLQRHRALHTEMRFHMKAQGEKVAHERSFELLHDFCAFFIDWILHHERVVDAPFYTFIQRRPDDIAAAA